MRMRNKNETWQNDSLVPASGPGLAARVCSTSLYKLQDLDLIYSAQVQLLVEKKAKSVLCSPLKSMTKDIIYS